MSTEVSNPVWNEVPDSLRTETQSLQRRWKDLYGAIKSGKTVFVREEHSNRAMAALRAAIAKDQPTKMLHSRKFEHNGESGHVLWMDDRGDR